MFENGRFVFRVDENGLETEGHVLVLRKSLKILLVMGGEESKEAGKKTSFNDIEQSYLQKHFETFVSQVINFNCIKPRKPSHIYAVVDNYIS